MLILIFLKKGLGVETSSGNMCIVIVCSPVCDVINLEI